MIDRTTPVIGPWMAKIGQVQDIASNPCSISPEIWVKAFFHGVPFMVVSLFKPDPMDTKLDMLTGQRPHRRRRRFRPTDILRGTGGIPGVRGWWSFRLASLAQRLGWYMLIVDTGINQAVHWTSAAYAYAGCPIGGDGGVFGEADPSTAHTQGSGTDIAMWNVIDSSGDGISLGPSSILIQAKRSPFISASIGIKQNPQFPGGSGHIGGVRIVETATGRVVGETQAPPDKKPDTLMAVANNYEVLTGSSRSFRVIYDWTVTEGAMLLTSRVSGFAQKNLAVIGDP